MEVYERHTARMSGERFWTWGGTSARQTYYGKFSWSE